MVSGPHHLGQALPSDIALTVTIYDDFDHRLILKERIERLEVFREIGGH